MNTPWTEALLETAHLPRSPRTAARLLALEHVRSGSLPPLRLGDLKAQLDP